MGIMILPLVSSLSEDAMRAVPQALREGAYGLGCNRFEVATESSSRRRFRASSPPASWPPPGPSARR